MSFNLINQLSIEDKVKIKNYINLYGVSKNFIGVDEWLTYWGKEKIKLYKLLGGKVIHRIPFSCIKPKEELREEFANIYYHSKFVNNYYDWLEKNFYSKGYNEDRKSLEPDREIYFTCKRWIQPEILADDKTSGEPLKFRLPDKQKTFQIQPGTKPIRAISRLLNYCKDMEGVSDLIKQFEEFRIKHSMILNDKEMKGNLVFSIHPLDYMTMSDNAMGWHSCMSWVEEGCYHVGTVEMMNSNNVLCCYIENTSKEYNFNKNTEVEDPAYTWTNKRWRQLVYVTKDIAVCGKAYPYQNENYSKAILDEIKKLAKENLGWTYSFGPELYKDMKYINSLYTMNRARSYMRYNPKKHNILFDTKGMYNDMLNDSDTDYWCIRNKVKKTKIISYSGKAPCLCCGESVISDNDNNDDYYDYYNERYNNVGNVVCEDCLKDFTCTRCGETYTQKGGIIEIKIKGVPAKFCKSCLQSYIHECPTCHKPYLTLKEEKDNNDSTYFESSPINTFIRLKPDIDEQELSHVIWSNCEYHSNFYSRYQTVWPICMCNSCLEKDTRFKKIEVHPPRTYIWDDPYENIIISNNVMKKEDWEDYFPYNIKTPEIKEGMEIN